MAGLVIFHIEPGINTEGGDDIVYTGRARCSGMGPTDGDITWMAIVDPASLATSINEAIKSAAIDAALEQQSVTIGVLDKKTIIGGALGL